MMRLKDQEEWVLAFAHILDVCHIPPDLQDGLNYRLWRYGVLSKMINTISINQPMKQSDSYLSLNRPERDEDV